MSLRLAVGSFFKFPEPFKFQETIQVVGALFILNSTPTSMDAGQERALKRHRGDEKTDKIREHHPSLFFEDGNVVLATESWLFCVHKSILKSYSPVFESLFDLPQPSDSHSDTYLEMPMVFMSGDTDEDVIILLRTIYERKYVLFHTAQNPFPLTLLQVLRCIQKDRHKCYLRTSSDKHEVRNWHSSIRRHAAIKNVLPILPCQLR